MDVYLLVGHRQLRKERWEETIFLKLPVQDRDLPERLSKAYRQMPDPLRLVLLLSVYDEMSDDEIAELLRCMFRMPDSTADDAFGIPHQTG